MHTLEIVEVKGAGSEKALNLGPAVLASDVANPDLEHCFASGTPEER